MLALTPSALPALRVAGALFLIINLLGAAYFWHFRRQFFGPDSTATGDRVATRQLAAIVIGIPWLFITLRILYVWVKTWTG